MGICGYKRISAEKIRDEPMGSLIILNTTKGLLNILIKHDGIRFQSFEDASDVFKFIFISKEKYPKMFKQGIVNYSFISAKVIEDDKQIWLR